MSDDLAQRIQQAMANPQNVGELENADSVGTAGSADCGDMLRMWVKFKEDDRGRKVIDKATFQTFGCETALAVASVATELIAGKTVEEALNMTGSELAAPLGPLPPMKIHCAQLVEGALRSALTPAEKTPASTPSTVATAAAPATVVPSGPTGALIESFAAAPASAKVKVVLKTPPAPRAE